MTINTLPGAPTRSMSAAEFVTTANTFLAALPPFSSQVNADLAALLTLSQLVSTSTTSLTIGTGAKSLTVQTSKAYLVNQAVRIYSTASPDNYMDGTVTSYDSGTGALVVGVTSVGGSGTLAAWTITLNGGLALQSLALTQFADSSVPVATAAEHAARLSDVSLFPTVAPAAVPDIFAAVGATINYSGAAVTCTDIADCAAAQIGMTKRIIPAANANFTASANMVIDGATSGTYIMPAGALIEVLAVAVDTFKVSTILAVGSFTGTMTGCSSYSAETQVFDWQKVGRVVTITQQTSAELAGTSNSTGKTITGMPAEIRPLAAKRNVCVIFNAGGEYVPGLTSTAPSGVITVYATLTGGNWTASGTATIWLTSITYSI